MNDWPIQISFFVVGIMMALMLLGLGVSAIIPGIDRWNKRYFTALFAVLSLLITVALADIIVYDDPGFELLKKILWYLEPMLISVPILMFSALLLHTCGESINNSPLFISVLVLWAAYNIMLLLTQFTDWFYYIETWDVFVKGPFYPLLPSPILIALCLMIAGVLRRRNNLAGKHYLAFLIYLIPQTIAIFIHVLFYSIPILEIGITISALTMFGIIQLDNIEQYMYKQQEIAQQRANIMVLQMRPHFIYNTMMSIYYLCDQDPQKAKQVIMDFTTYLRKNFTAIASEEPIPFTEELEHTQAYLTVEQEQFEDSLFVNYDTPHTQFRVPPLTLQPIVENAVKHGMDPDGEPLHIYIKTRETEAGSEIIVEDNGSGYAPVSDDEPHIALENIKQRLKMMCDGELTIADRDGGGTVVTVTIPE